MIYYLLLLLYKFIEEMSKADNEVIRLEKHYRDMLRALQGKDNERKNN